MGAPKATVGALLVRLGFDYLSHCTQFCLRHGLDLQGGYDFIVLQEV